MHGATLLLERRVGVEGVRVAELKSAEHHLDRATCTLIVIAGRRPDSNHGGRVLDGL